MNWTEEELRRQWEWERDRYLAEQEAEEREAQAYYEYIQEEKLKSTISLIGDIIYKLMSYKEIFEPWLAEQPADIQELAKKYPPGTYKIADDAPYSITAPGCTVLLISWLKNGMVGVMIKGKDKSEEALEHEAMLCEQYKKSKEEAQKIHDADVSAHVDPKHLILVSNELEG